MNSWEMRINDMVAILNPYFSFILNILAKRWGEEMIYEKLYTCSPPDSPDKILKPKTFQFIENSEYQKKPA